MKKVFISADEICRVGSSSENYKSDELSPSTLPLFARLVFAPLALFLPLLALVAPVVWLRVKRHDSKTRLAWLNFLLGLILASIYLTIIGGGVVFLNYAPRPQTLLPEAVEPFSLEGVTTFPDFSKMMNVPTEVLAKNLRPIVFIVAPATKRAIAFPNQKALNRFGAGVLLYANEESYLVGTSRHIFDGEDWQSRRVFEGDAVIRGERGGFRTAEIAGRHKSLDLALLSLSRESREGAFAQQIVSFKEIRAGQPILTFGHPQGMLFSISDGLISRIDDKGLVQISAPVGPGASGGPVFDSNGHLVGLISGMIDKSLNPQAENLNFAVRADAFLQSESWQLTDVGEQLMIEFLAAAQPVSKTQAPGEPTNLEPPSEND